MGKKSKIIWALALFGSLFLDSSALAEEDGTTTYVIKVQKERKDTRFTLTEWLRIKERMKMMDVWLAMFSDPSKDKFSPELNLSYHQTASQIQYLGANGSRVNIDSSKGTMFKGQLWLTNLVTASTGRRALNIDFGIEGGQKNFLDLTLKDPSALQVNTGTGISSEKATQMRNHYAAGFRVFGKSIQDSSLILKVGHYQNRHNVSLYSDDQRSQFGMMAGAELSLYLFHWLGAEGSYSQFGGIEQGNPGSDMIGKYFDYAAYIEVAILRLMVGKYQENWMNNDSSRGKAESGMFAGVKLML